MGAIFSKFNKRAEGANLHNCRNAMCLINIQGANRLKGRPNNSAGCTKFGKLMNRQGAIFFFFK